MSGTRRTGRWKPGESGNPAGRPQGTSGISKLRASVGEHIPEVIEKLAEQAKAGDTGAARLLLERVLPAVKPVDYCFPIDIPGNTLTDQGKSVIGAISSGALSPGQGGALLSALGAMVRIAEGDEMRRRIEALEAKQLQSSRS